MEDKEEVIKEVGGKAEPCKTEAKGRVCFKRMKWSTVLKSAEEVKEGMEDIDDNAGSVQWSD